MPNSRSPLVSDPALSSGTPQGERVNAELKNWRILRKIRSSPNTADKLIAAFQTLMIANA